MFSLLKSAESDAASFKNVSPPLMKFHTRFFQPEARTQILLALNIRITNAEFKGHALLVHSYLGGH